MTNTTASNGTYLGLISGGGFESYATRVNILTPCIKGITINNPNACFDQLPAAMGWNVVGDNWLPNKVLNVTGTLGMGIMSPFWT